MRSQRHCWVPLNLFVALLFPSLAAGDTIRITSGFVEFGGDAELVGNVRGFTLSGSYGTAGPNSYVFCPGEICDGGEVAQLDHAFSGLDLPMHSATIDGITYDRVNLVGEEPGATLGFSSTHVLPTSGITAVLNTPFTIQAGSEFVHRGGAFTLVGSGIVTTHWSAPVGSAPQWSLESARYEFSEAAAVPEPGTLLLLVTGIAAAAALSWRKRHA
jgi:hypothetical protein